MKSLTLVVVGTGKKWHYRSFTYTARLVDARPAEKKMLTEAQAR